MKMKVSALLHCFFSLTDEASVAIWTISLGSAIAASTPAK